jgi:hypothetical protein
MPGESITSKPETTEALTEELGLALDGFRQATQTLADVTSRAGEHIPEELLISRATDGTEYEELHRLWVLSPGEEALNLYGAHPEDGRD